MTQPILDATSVRIGSVPEHQSQLLPEPPEHSEGSAVHVCYFGQCQLVLMIIMLRPSRSHRRKTWPILIIGLFGEAVPNSPSTSDG